MWQKKEIKDNITLGDKYIKAKNWSDARKAFEEVLTIQDSEKVRVKLGNILLKQKDFAAARRVYYTLLTNNPDKIDYTIRLSTVLKKLKLPGEAADLLKSRIRERPDCPELHYYLAVMLEQLKQRDAARESYEEALSLQADYPACLVRLGKLEERLGNKVRADLLFSTAKKLFKNKFFLGFLPKEQLKMYFFLCLRDDDLESINQVKGHDLLKKRYLFSLDNRRIRDDLYAGIPHLSSEYIHQIWDSGGQHFYNKSIRCCDRSSPYFNVVDGIRKTIGVSENYDNSVHLFGSSRVFSSQVEDGHTIASFLQSHYNKLDAKVRVVNHGVPGQPIYTHLLNFLQCKLNKNDSIIVFYHLLTTKDGAHFLDMVNVFSIMREECQKVGAKFYIFILPHIFHIENPSEREKFLIEDLHRQSPHLHWQGSAQLAAALYSKEHGFHGAFLDYIIQRPHDMGETFFDYSHWNHQVNERIATEIAQIISHPTPPIGKEKPPTKTLSTMKRQSVNYLGRVAYEKYGDNPDICQWIKVIRNPDFDGLGTIGSIVMNCNPFTWGHYHLIEHAVSQVDGLYIFVVEEDLSVFPFADRLRLVREGVQSFGKKVHVVPSGNFIISSFSFPGYFSKEEVIKPADSTTDILIFGSIIAKALNITCRFVGEEPTCIVTNSYNDTMLFLLPDMGISVHTIPRKEYGDRPISASIVRKALGDNNAELVHSLVPPSTYAYLQETSRLTIPSIAQTERQSTSVVDNPILQNDLDELISQNDLSAFANTTVLVTGSTGLIGKITILALLNANRLLGLKVRIIAAARNPDKAFRIFQSANTTGALDIIPHDLSEPLQINEKIDYILHSAGATQSRFFVEQPVETIMSIVNGTRHILDLAAQKHIRSMVYLSSLEVYGVVSNLNVSESDYGYLDPVQIRSSYSESKRLAECLCVAYAHQHDVPVSIARLTQTFGAGCPYDDPRVFAEFARAVLEKRAIELHTTGETQRSYCYTTDAISAIFTLFNARTRAETYNIANPDSFVSIRELAEHTVDGYPSSSVSIKPDNMDRGYNPTVKINLNTTKIQALGWRPRINLPEMLSRLLNSMERERAQGAVPRS